MSDQGSVPKPGYGDARCALHQAAIAVVARSGIRGLTYREVAREARVTPGAVQHHFDSLEHLLVETLDAVVFNARRNGLTSARIVLEDTETELRARVSATHDLQVFQYQMILESTRRPAFRPAVHRLYDSYIEATRSELHNAFDGLDEIPGLSALIYFAIDGIVLHGIARPDASTDAPLALAAILTQLRRSQTEQ